LPEDLRPRAEVVFTAHSIPESMAARYPYQSQFEESSRLVMEQIARLEPHPPSSYRTVYQSRSGRPEDPWLGPDIGETIRDLGGRRAPAAIVAPIGFVCDHVEVLYDLDIEAAEVARELQLPFVRALGVNDHPRFLDMLADVVLQVRRRYAQTRPLELVPQP
jgi:ferrochelatase